MNLALDEVSVAGQMDLVILWAQSDLLVAVGLGRATTGAVAGDLASFVVELDEVVD